MPLPTKDAKLHPWAEGLNFSTIKINELLKFTPQGNDLALFIGNETKVKIPAEIKPPLVVQWKLIC